MIEPRKLKAGDWVWYPALYGRPPEPARIKHIDLCARPGAKYGVPVEEVFVIDLPRCTLDLDNGHFAYGHNLKVMTDAEIRALGLEEKAA